MAQKTLTAMQSPSGHVRYTRKQIKGDKANEKLALKKYDPTTRTHQLYKQVKKLKSVKKKK